MSMANLASVYFSQGKYAEAEALHSQSLEITRRIFGPENPDTLMSMNDLANVYLDRANTRGPRRFTARPSRSNVVS